jgi:hypothetical protein
MNPSHAMNSASVSSREVRRLLWLGLVAIISLSAGSLHATGILIQTSQGGPHQYNGGGGFAWSVAFEFPEAVKVQAIQGWMAGNPGDTGAVGIFSDLPVNPLLPGLDLKTFSLKGIDLPPPGEPEPPARWEGVSGLDWVFQPGIYSIVFKAGFMPYGFGGPSTPGPYPLTRTFQTFYDGGWNDNDGPIGLRIYGAPLSAVPEPATYGLLGSAMLLGIAAYGKYRRAGKIEKVIV